MQNRIHFSNRWLGFALMAPQLAITLIFFLWPALEALWQSVQQQDPFGLDSQFVGLAGRNKKQQVPMRASIVMRLGNAEAIGGNLAAMQFRTDAGVNAR